MIQIIPEPLGGAHRDPILSCDGVKKAVDAHLTALLEMPPEVLVERRYDKYRNIGLFSGK